MTNKTPNDYQQQYINYLKNIKVGDTVFPAYDGKGSRATVCKVVDIKDDKLVVVGALWGFKDKVITSLFSINTGEAWVVYEPNEPTLMDYLFNKDEEGDEAGDFYQLVTFEEFDASSSLFGENILSVKLN